MNWKLILMLSLGGLVMAFATTFWIPTRYESFLWLAIFFICALIISKQCESKFFLNGFMTSMANSVWITAIHILFYTTFMLNHPDLAAMDDGSFLPGHPRLRMLLMGPLIGALTGLVQGFFAFLAALYFKSRSTT